MSIFSDVISTADGKVCHSKLWCNIAYLAGTIKFIMIPNPTADIWMAYLGIVGSAAVASKYISMKYKETPVQ